MNKQQLIEKFNSISSEEDQLLIWWHYATEFKADGISNIPFKNKMKHLMFHFRNISQLQDCIEKSKGYNANDKFALYNPISNTLKSSDKVIDLVDQELLSCWMMKQPQYWRSFES